MFVVLAHLIGVTKSSMTIHEKLWQLPEYLILFNTWQQWVHRAPMALIITCRY